MGLVLLGSQFPLSPHSYKALFPGPHSEHIACMMDGVCMVKTSGSMNMPCSCHEKHGDRPFYCSCGTHNMNVISSLQLSKVLLPVLVEAERNLEFSFLPVIFSDDELQSYSKDIFHPPQIA